MKLRIVDLQGWKQYLRLLVYYIPIVICSVKIYGIIFGSFEKELKSTIWHSLEGFGEVVGLKELS